MSYVKWPIRNLSTAVGHANFFAGYTRPGRISAGARSTFQMWLRPHENPALLSLRLGCGSGREVAVGSVAGSSTDPGGHAVRARFWGTAWPCWWVPVKKKPPNPGPLDCALHRISSGTLHTLRRPVTAVLLPSLTALAASILVPVIFSRCPGAVGSESQSSLLPPARQRHRPLRLSSARHTSAWADPFRVSRESRTDLTPARHRQLGGPNLEQPLW